MFHYVYVLYSASLQKLYRGVTQDWLKRIEHHNLGLDKWTKRGVPWKLIYYEAYTNKSDAYKREKFLKSGRGREVLNKQLEKTLSLVEKAR